MRTPTLIFSKIRRPSGPSLPLGDFYSQTVSLVALLFDPDIILWRDFVIIFGKVAAAETGACEKKNSEWTLELFDENWSRSFYYTVLFIINERLSQVLEFIVICTFLNGKKMWEKRVERREKRKERREKRKGRRDEREERRVREEMAKKWNIYLKFQ